MTYAEGLKKGLSLSFFCELSEETMREAALNAEKRAIHTKN